LKDGGDTGKEFSRASTSSWLTSVKIAQKANSEAAASEHEAVHPGASLKSLCG
jgi:hypothetical protein